MKQKAYVRGDMDECPRCGAPLNDNAVCDACGWPSTAMGKRAERKAFEAGFKAAMSMFDILIDGANVSATATFDISGRRVDGTVDGVFFIETPDGSDIFQDDFFVDFDGDIFDSGREFAAKIVSAIGLDAVFSNLSYFDDDGNEWELEYDSSIVIDAQEIENKLQPYRNDWNARQMMMTTFL